MLGSGFKWALCGDLFVVFKFTSLNPFSLYLKAIYFIQSILYKPSHFSHPGVPSLPLYIKILVDNLDNLTTSETTSFFTLFVGFLESHSISHTFGGKDVVYIYVCTYCLYVYLLNNGYIFNFTSKKS